ncbi:hypothetical protein Y5S_03097 [Alcanivorax nanhaiticus]|uniref:Uncharacterized protein n=1 Tax=Alcanivorax nanhaiticus TaxID=1177154 RepID=A0A095SH60_9GAMM|nr:hypothetical protein [Alcanivorax nanhaiticus]KGD63674.1 hypothetical protein Y5S_03097 [Alcanivorax nanhaiticus]
MIEKFIAKVPSRIWAEGRPGKSRLWEAEFNVASWVRVAGAPGQVQLVVRYMDKDKERAVLVDTADVKGEGSALLSGSILLKLSAEVEQVQVSLRLADPAMTFVVEELFMQRRGSSLGASDKLISNF